MSIKRLINSELVKSQTKAEFDKLKEQITNILILLSQLKNGNYGNEHKDQILDHLNKTDPKFIEKLSDLTEYLSKCAPLSVEFASSIYFIEQTSTIMLGLTAEIIDNNKTHSNKISFIHVYMILHFICLLLICGYLYSGR